MHEVGGEGAWTTDEIGKCYGKGLEQSCSIFSKQERLSDQVQILSDSKEEQGQQVGGSERWVQQDAHAIDDVIPCLLYI